VSSFLKITTGLDPKQFPETSRAVLALEAAWLAVPEVRILSLVAKGVVAVGVAEVLSVTLADDLRHQMQRTNRLLQQQRQQHQQQLQAPW
jgi:hypothetical protein